MFRMNRTFFAWSAMALALLATGCSAGSPGLSTVQALPLENRAPAKKTPVDSILFVTNYHDVTLYDTLSGASQGSITKGILFPVSIAFDASGNLFIGNTAGGKKMPERSPSTRRRATSQYGRSRTASTIRFTSRRMRPATCIVRISLGTPSRCTHRASRSRRSRSATA